MSIITDILQDIPIPNMVKIKQNFPAEEVTDVEGTLRQEMANPGIGEHIKPGMEIAITVGSRGMAQLPVLVRVIVEEVKRRGAKPFIVPAMGSHGGATAEGQCLVLENLGVTEASAGCPIRSSMEVVEVGRLDNGLEVLIDKNAYEADGIIVLNRVKAHNAFSGPNESGIVKMITIGLGKQKGADSCHAYSFKYMAKFIAEMAKIKLAKTKILFGIGTVENAYDKIAKIRAVPSEQIIEEDSRLLLEAKKNMPHLMFEQIDVLVVDQLGKEFSGGGMDPYTTGRGSTPYIHIAKPVVGKLAVLDITDNSHGNACGMGLADSTTRRLFDKINFGFTYANILTSTNTVSGKIPMIMDTDILAIQAAIKTCNAPDLKRIRMVRIPNTLKVGEIMISETMLAEAAANSQIEILSDPEPMQFSTSGNLLGY